jgi:hypothetical protein
MGSAFCIYVVVTDYSEKVQMYRYHPVKQQAKKTIRVAAG